MANLANLGRWLMAGSLLMGTAFAQAEEADQALIQRGEALAIAGDCAACHSEQGQPAYSGGHAIKSPLGTIISTNITPSHEAGIGDYTLAQFTAALQEGKRGDGRQLYPAMPYTAFAKLSDDDVAALYAYFMREVEPSDVTPPETHLPFPFNVRASMAAWNLLFLDDTPFEANPERSEAYNRGAYLVQGAAHCSTCHTPRNMLIAEKTDEALAGASLGAWYAPNITADVEQGIGGWRRDQLVDYLRTGHASNGATAAGPMLEAIDKSFSHMPREDVEAMAVYLLPDGGDDVANATAHNDDAPGIAALKDDDTPAALTQISPGERIYRNQCSACHAPNGSGLNGLPPLRNHPVLAKPNADNVAMAVLEGVWPEERQGMLGFADDLDDAQVADVTNYLMDEFGDSSVTIDTARVTELRAGGAASSLLFMARAGLALGALVILLLALGLWRRRKSRR